MKISAKGRYALLLMLDLAEFSGCGYVALKDIAERRNISKKYLEQIIPLLSREGLLKTNRGVNGGYMLSRPASSYTAADILSITETGLFASDKDEEETVVRNLSDGLDKAIRGYLESLTLQSLLDSSRVQDADNYMI